MAETKVNRTNVMKRSGKTDVATFCASCNAKTANLGKFKIVE